LFSSKCFLNFVVAAAAAGAAACLDAMLQMLPYACTRSTVLLTRASQYQLMCDVVRYCDT